MSNSYKPHSMTRFIAPLATVLTLILSSAMVIEAVFEVVLATLA
jgi:hypothetical protein